MKFKRSLQNNQDGGTIGVSRSPFISTSSLLILIVSHASCVYVGSLFATNSALGKSSMYMEHKLQECPPVPSCPASNHTAKCPPNPKFDDCPVCEVCAKCPAAPDCQPCEATKVSGNNDNNNHQKQERLFPKTVEKFAVGMAHSTKADFLDNFEVGVPADRSTQKADRDVLYLYSRYAALPTSMRESKSQKIEFMSAKNATENCDYLHVLFHYRGGNRDLCLAIVPQYESYHIQNWMRVPEGKGGGERKHPLRLVSRGKQFDGEDNFAPPRWLRHTKPTWGYLKTYMDSLEGILADLQNIVKRIKKNNTVIVMVCNFGQSQLLINFVCAAKSRGLDVSNVLVFATDEETKELVEQLGLAAFYEPTNFGRMPKEAAGEYGDEAFTVMMMGKVMCVHLVSLTGVDLLFQDVDIVWYKNPLTYFHNETSTTYGYDVYFQDDGARSLRYSPYSANSGFYYIRNNHRSQYFLTQLMLAGDLIRKTYSHQQALIAVLSEHASLYGLKVKVMSKEEDEFPGGVHYHQRGKDAFFVRRHKNQLTADPYIFHMSWTLNKDNKLKFFRQLGEWYVEEKCVDKKASEIDTGGKSFSDTCCAAEALFSCHYRDKPSKKPCHDSPALDSSKPSFWKEFLEA